MKGPDGKPWQGTTEILERRNQVPKKSYTPIEVTKICLQALQNNDDPQLDHGACVVLAFKSPNGLLASSSLDPAGYARFIRNEYSGLIDFYKADVIGQPIELKDSLSVKQRVEITGYNVGNTRSVPQQFDFYLTKVDEYWLVDVILSVLK